MRKPSSPRSRGALAVLAALALWGCGARHPEAKADAPKALPDLEQADVAAKQYPSFDRYWYRGKAELSRYELEQARYGEEHPGEAVLIFVTEDFLKTKQVKYEGHGDASDATNVLKLNAYRRFYTGIYPYTVLTSVFAPARDANALPLKVSFSAQEWCGHTYTQLNRRADHFAVDEHSYFEAEGDRTSSLKLALLEDGLWTRIRTNPDSLPRGRIEIVPSVMRARLDHVPLRAEPAEATLSEAQAGERVFRLTYDQGRSLAITFEAAFPHRILRFEERANRSAPITRARLTHSILLPYWEKHGADDAPYRKALGLTW